MKQQEEARRAMMNQLKEEEDRKTAAADLAAKKAKENEDALGKCACWVVVVLVLIAFSVCHSVLFTLCVSQTARGETGSRCRSGQSGCSHCTTASSATQERSGNVD